MSDVLMLVSQRQRMPMLMSLTMLTKLDAKVILKNVNSRVSGNC